MTGPLLAVENLSVHFGHGGTASPAAVDDVSFTVGRGERVAIVGESGSGKTASAMAVARLVEFQTGSLGPRSRILFDDTDLAALAPADLRAYRGNRIGMVFQDHQGALNPIHSIGRQIIESMTAHDEVRRPMAAARDTAESLLAQVGFRDPRRSLDLYPHELSGGMRQRALIAMALAAEPDLLIADEPTTALDAVVQQQIIELLRSLSVTRQFSVLLISHDLDLVTEFADRVYVMYAGKIVESGPVRDILGAPQHPYTRALIGARPTPRRGHGIRLAVIPGSAPALGRRPEGCRFHPRCPLNDGDACVRIEPELVGDRQQVACHHPGELRPAAIEPFVAAAPVDPLREQVLSVENLTFHYSRRRGSAGAAIEDIDFLVLQGESFGLLGESGSGKSTLARCLMGLQRPQEGRILFRDQDIAHLRGRPLRDIRRHAQMVFQDPRASLDPRMDVGSLLSEPLRIHRMWGQRGHDRAALVELLEVVGLSEPDLRKYPHEFSGGQLQRVAIARALTLRPSLLICDEVTASLDASVSAQIVNLLQQLQSTLGLTYVMITHDLVLARYFCDRVAVMRHGRIVEQGDAADVFARPADPYTRSLIATMAAAPETEG